MATYDELKAQLEQLVQEAEQEKAREVAVALEQIRETVAKYGIEPGRIFPNWMVVARLEERRRASTPKYRNPETGETWVGRGRAPNWMVGHPREAFLVVGANAKTE
jgi:DNA-binding protein H-NS